LTRYLLVYAMAHRDPVEAMTADVEAGSNSLTLSLEKKGGSPGEAEDGARSRPEPAPEESPQKKRSIAEGYPDRTSPQGSTQQERKVVTSETKPPKDIIEGCRFPEDLKKTVKRQDWKLTVKKCIELSLHSARDAVHRNRAGKRYVLRHRVWARREGRVPCGPGCAAKGSGPVEGEGARIH